MIAVIKGDIINSRTIENPDEWLIPLKRLFNEWGKCPSQWELAWGDAFQLEISDVVTVLYKTMQIKSLIRSISPTTGNISNIGVRMAIGIGRKEHSGTRVSESNGEAFHYSGEVFRLLKREKRTLILKTPWEDFDEDINLYLKLACTFIDNWSVSSANLVSEVLKNPDATQEEIGEILGIKQNSVSGRWTRANMDELLAVEKIFRKKIQKYNP